MRRHVRSGCELGGQADAVVGAWPTVSNLIVQIILELMIKYGYILLYEKSFQSDCFNSLGGGIPRSSVMSSRRPGSAEADPDCLSAGGVASASMVSSSETASRLCNGPLAGWVLNPPTTTILGRTFSGEANFSSGVVESQKSGTYGWQNVFLGQSECKWKDICVRLRREVLGLAGKDRGWQH